MIAIPKDHKNARKAEDARRKLEAAGVDPATIGLIVSLILQGLPLLKNLIDKLIKHNPA